MKNRLIVALDMAEFEKAKKLVDILYPTVRIFKVGSELFTACGQDIIKIIQRKGGKVFLDLKFHDIPNTVVGSVRAATRLGVFMFTVHTLGGPEMLRSAVEIRNQTSAKLNIEKPKILGVTILTSMDNESLKNIGMNGDVKEAVSCLAGLAKRAGLDGIVASAKEITCIKKALGKDFTVVTPGIRPRSVSKGDQKRVVTPGEAIAKGADYIVVGRAITAAKNPKVEAEKILVEMKNA